ncbi:unnamed protein product [Vitrella brassicaformis CCMP3155]|uniref:Uncharacterized protein n=1 Tax=Vitrella brassicaformis (strain CCMP3155) TaxID=1169540 RepID=A0A0G4FNQ7_VITBC|nr:unnamed protein product [Vitrella brassicaformis CCMP3155]|eukprot:CEM15707.1 unnamed protein product [Vitrella brassicaformis CCMP3155]
MSVWTVCSDVSYGRLVPKKFCNVQFNDGITEWCEKRDIMAIPDPNDPINLKMHDMLACSSKTPKAPVTCRLCGEQLQVRTVEGRGSKL